MVDRLEIGVEISLIIERGRVGRCAQTGPGMEVASRGGAQELVDAALYTDGHRWEWRGGYGWRERLLVAFVLHRRSIGFVLLGPNTSLADFEPCVQMRRSARACVTARECDAAGGTWARVFPELRAKKHMLCTHVAWKTARCIDPDTAKVHWPMSNVPSKVSVPKGGGFGPRERTGRAK